MDGKITITVTQGEAVCTPVPYHSFRVGPLTVSVELPSGTSPVAIEKATERLRLLLRDQLREEYATAREFWANEWRASRG